MQIYIISSWKNQHAVEMLTNTLRQNGHEVLSFIENSYGDGHGPEKPVSFEEWVNTGQAVNSFVYGTNAAATSDLIIYIGPSGTDAWAEVGIAYGSGIPVYGLWAKGEQIGIMRKMVEWFARYPDLLDAIDTLKERYK